MIRIACKRFCVILDSLWPPGKVTPPVGAPLLGRFIEAVILKIVSAGSCHAKEIIEWLVLRLLILAKDMHHIPPTLLQRRRHDEKRVDSKLTAELTEILRDIRLHDRRLTLRIVRILRAEAAWI